MNGDSVNGNTVKGEPLMTERRVQTICLLLLATIATGAALQALSEVMIPFALAVFFSIALAPVVDFLGAKTRLSRPVSVGITMLLGALMLAILAAVVAQSLDQVGSVNFSDPETWKPVRPGWFPGPDSTWETLTEGVQALIPKFVGVLGSFLSQGITVLIFLMFLLVEQGRTRGRGSPASLNGTATVSGTVESRVKKYISVKVLTSAVTGTLVGLALWAIGVPAAVLFGLLTFLLNFIPTIGSVIAVLLPIPVLMSNDASLVTMALALGIPGAIQFVVGQIWENKLLGDAFDLRASVVLLALVFWGKIWGIVGMLLATPIMAVLKTLMEGWEVTRPLAKMMGQAGPPIEVCAAVVISRDGKILIARRTRPADVAGKWEFPGGKLEENESAAVCLVREFQEELGYAIVVGERLGSSMREGGEVPLRLTAFAARPADESAVAVPRDGTHDEVRWVSRDELGSMAERGELAPLDVPLVATIPSEASLPVPSV
ncbi:CTP pyrophosphohydrolase [Planctomycetes bacterium Poly30]|uniref:8-oxo-dGTP diphosphatase n=1 Tax=Saltatorellus ferox TaxID=2528018 RepID=A0A518ESW1_9BACT|nr:CTP pyrophosphohydrolase [Planctomycetes bacterium Poly30]